VARQKTDKGNNRRLTPAMKQELISRCQLSERLINFGWLPNSTILDLGEDFLVQVYLDSKATGVTFQIQVKSTRNLYKHRSRKGDFLTYQFPVKDLRHWEAFDVPAVVLFVWDCSAPIKLDTKMAFLSEHLPR
jgi:hypothetical protein